MLEPLLTTEEAARLLKLASITLRKWRISGAGPGFIYCGAAVRYRCEDLAAWVAAHRVASTSAPRAQPLAREVHPHGRK